MPPAPSSDLATLSLSVIIVNYGAGDLVIANMASVLEGAKPFASVEVVVVDNASPGGDGEELEAAFAGEPRVKVIRSEKNGGFAYGNNRGLEAAAPADMTFFLNPDAKPRDGAIERMALTLLEREGVGVVGPFLVNDEGEARAAAFRKSTPFMEYRAGGGILSNQLGDLVATVQPVPEGEVVEADWIPGAAMMCSRALIDRVGGMDEGYFLYFEETDWFDSIRRAGFGVVVDGRAVVEHIEGVSTGIVSSQERAADYPAYWYDSWRRYWVKNHGRGTAALAGSLFMAGLLTRKARNVMVGYRAKRGVYMTSFWSKAFLPILFGGRP